MTGIRRAIAVLWPLVLLLAFLATFRRVPAQTVSTAETVDCDRPFHATANEGSDLAILERCVALDPDNAALLTDLAVSYEACHRGADAEAMYRRALAVDPRDADVHVRLGALLLERGNRTAARAEADAALRWHPNSGPAADLAARFSSAAEAGR